MLAIFGPPSERCPVLPHIEFWPFLGPLPGHPIDLPEHPEHPEHPKHQNGHKPCFCENVAGRFHQKMDYIVCPALQCLSLLFYFCLSCVVFFVSFVLRSWQFPGLSFCAPTSMVLDIVEGQGRGRAQKWPKFIME